VAETFDDGQIVGQFSDVIGDSIEWLVNNSTVNDFG
jgi:hypothetical protein